MIDSHYCEDHDIFYSFENEYGKCPECWREDLEMNSDLEFEEEDMEEYWEYEQRMRERYIAEQDERFFSGEHSAELWDDQWSDFSR